MTDETAAALNAMISYWLKNGGARDAGAFIASKAGRNSLTARLFNAMLKDGEVTRADVAAALVSST
jgi:hypothetical protein